MLAARLRAYLELVKFPHTIFALPFALASVLLAAGGLPAWRVLGWIVVAMVGARTAAMAFNRLLDRHLDALNPRTAGREIPAGVVSPLEAGVLTLLAAGLFIFAAWQLNPLAGVLSLPALIVLLGYSWCKRFTSLSHLVLGLALGLAPPGAWIGVRQSLGWAPVVLGLAVMLWVAGFDIIYATLDEEFDRRMGLHSMVQRWGVARALRLAALLHAGFVVFLLGLGWLAGLSALYYAGLGVLAIILAWEHHLVSPTDLRRVNTAFFTLNGVVSVLFLLLIAADLVVRRQF